MRILSCLLFAGAALLSGCAETGSDGSTEPLLSGDDAPQTAEECQALGGRVVWDPGNGSARCADDEELVSTLPIGIEPVLCCL